MKELYKSFHYGRANFFLVGFIALVQFWLQPGPIVAASAVMLGVDMVTIVCENLPVLEAAAGTEPPVSAEKSRTE